MILCNWASGGRGGGKIAQRNKSVSISCELAFSKVLFFIYLQIDCPEDAGRTTSSVISTAWPASGCFSLLSLILAVPGQSPFTFK